MFYAYKMQTNIHQIVDKIRQYKQKRFNFTSAREKKRISGSNKFLSNLKKKQVSRNIFLNFFADKIVYYKISSISILSFLVVGSNIISSQANARSQFVWVDQEASVKIASALDLYTPLIDENNSHLEMAVKGAEDGFLIKPNISKEATSDFQYRVAEGDTITQIARKFDVSVATIQKVNNLSALDLEKINPGTTLVIPPYTTENSLAWLGEINDEKRRIAQEAEQKRLVAERARLARQKRTVAYRDQSSARETSSSYEGNASVGLIVPIASKGITRGITSYHTGIDYRADVGTPVVASQSGKIVESTGGWGRGWGNSLVVDHGGGLHTRYAHLSSFAVGVGNYVKQGQIIGYSGNTGLSTGPHLHFEAHVNGRVVNPYSQ